MEVSEFKVEQTNDDVIFKIPAPCGNPYQAEIFIDKEEFTFNSSPYFLRLRLPGQMLDSDDGSGFYDEHARCFVVRVKKASPGEKFNLAKVERTMEPDLIDLSDKVKLTYITETGKDIGVTTHNQTDGALASISEEQVCLNPNPPTITTKYGFANKYHSMFGQYYSEFAEMIDLPNPDIPVAARNDMRTAEEQKKWNDDHYLADTMETDHIVPFIRFRPWWASPEQDELTQCDEETLADIRNKNPDAGSVPPGTAVDILERQIIDVVLSYSYDHRTTEGDPTVESGWTINKLSPTLSWFEEPPSLEAVVRSFYRRCLCYPLYRNFDLTTTVHQDVVAILKLGPAHITRCLLETKRIFDDSEPRYLLNRIYIHDLATYAYTSLSAPRLTELAQQLEQMEVRKEELNFGIAELEVAAMLVLREETLGGRGGDTATVINRLSKMTLRDVAQSDTDSDPGSCSNSDGSGSDTDESSTSSCTD